jgi:hypothetical protein
MRADGTLFPKHAFHIPLHSVMQTGVTSYLGFEPGSVQFPDTLYLGHGEHLLFFLLCRRWSFDKESLYDQGAVSQLPLIFPGNSR